MTKIQKEFYKLMADLIFWFHVAVGFVLIFFWEFKSLYPYYLATLIISLTSNTVSDFCFLAKWEHYFRKKLDPTLDFKSFFYFYFKKFFGLNVNLKIAHNLTLAILWAMASLNIIYWIYIYARA